MTALVEGNIQITLPPGTTFRKFDDPSSHGLSHCMKAVDFVVELSDKVLFIEIKDPQHPRAKLANATSFISRFQSGKLDEDLKSILRTVFDSAVAARVLHFYSCVTRRNPRMEMPRATASQCTGDLTPNQETTT